LPHRRPHRRRAERLRAPAGNDGGRVGAGREQGAGGGSGGRRPARRADRRSDLRVRGAEAGNTDGRGSEEDCRPAAQLGGEGDRADREAEGHPLRRQPAQDALGQDHAAPLACHRQGRGDHAGCLDAREPGDPGAAEAGALKLALFADIHSNLEALTACLDHAAALGAERHAFLGDLVGYGADPVAVLELVQAHAARGAIVVLGNHDAAALGRVVVGLNGQALAAIAWTRPRLAKRQLDFLEALPTSVREADRLYVHASAAVPERWTYVSGPRQATLSMQAANAAI